MLYILRKAGENNFNQKLTSVLCSFSLELAALPIHTNIVFVVRSKNIFLLLKCFQSTLATSVTTGHLLPSTLNNLGINWADPIFNPLRFVKAFNTLKQYGNSVI